MRSKILLFMFDMSLGFYQKCTRKAPWLVSKSDLELFPTGTLGCALNDFLQKNNFSLQDKLENHDVIHVLTNTGITVHEEIGMQFYLLGNGKRNLYASFSILSGIFFYPEKLKQFRQQFRLGKTAKPFHHINFKFFLSAEIEQFKEEYEIQKY